MLVHRCRVCTLEHALTDKLCGSEQAFLWLGRTLAENMCGDLEMTSDGTGRPRIEGLTSSRQR